MGFESSQSAGVASAKESLTASIKNTFKMTHTKAVLHEDSKKFNIPAQSIDVPAGKTYKVEYIYKKTDLEGTIDEVKEIKSSTDNGCKKLYNFPEISLFNPQVGYAYDDSALNAMPYQFYNQLSNMYKDYRNKNSNVNNWDSTAFTIKDMEGKNHSIHANFMLGSVYLDQRLQKAYMIQKSVPFVATAAGHDFTLRVYDVTDGVDKFLKEQPVIDAVAK